MKAANFVMFIKIAMIMLIRFSHDYINNHALLVQYDIPPQIYNSKIKIILHLTCKARSVHANILENTKGTLPDLSNDYIWTNVSFYFQCEYNNNQETTHLLGWDVAL